MGARSATPEHECRQGRRCKARHRDDEDQWHGAGVEEARKLCRPCEEHAFADIRQLDDDWMLLTAARTMIRSHLSGPKVSGSSDLKVPISLAVDAMDTAFTEETTRWARRLRREDGLTAICSMLGTLIDLPPKAMTVWAPHADGGDNITTMILDGVDGVLRLSRLHHRAVKVLGLEEERDQRLGESCHVCGREALTISLKTNLITCRSCRNVWHQDAFARLNNPLAAA